MLNDFISVIDNCISKDDCQQYIDWIEHYISNGVVFKENVDYHTKDHFTINCNNHTEYDLLAGDNLSIYFLPTIKKPIDDYLKKFSTLGKEKLLIYDTKIKKIPIGGGFHDWHYENPGVQSSPRKLVAQLYLNTIEEGGETEFLYINKRIKAEQGRLIIFPAAFTHTHRGNPPIGEDKYILSTWVVSQDNRG
jgi:hypothetical protein|tara:strand:+ start:520 stop:1095 length:576 start_codon:yes stop_codon:yes gene_type:complete